MTLAILMQESSIIAMSVAFIAGFSSLLLLFHKIIINFESHDDEWAKITSLKYWVATIAMAITGVILTAVYIASEVIVNPLFAFHIGATAPAILAKFIEKPVELPK